MAKNEFAVGDVVRLKRNIEVGDIKIRKTSKGIIRKMETKFFGTDQYWIRWSGTSFDMQMNGARDFVSAQVDDSNGVFKS